MRTALAVISILCLSLLGNAQVSNDSVLTRIGCVSSTFFKKVINIDSVNIFSYKLSNDKQVVSQTILKANPNLNLSDLLQKQSGIFIRSRGTAALSTPSYKGLGSLQTPILINGANMQSSMNGTMDLSLVDAAHFSKLSVADANEDGLGMPNTGTSISAMSGYHKPMLSANIGTSTQLDKNVNLQYANHTKKTRYFISASGSSSPNRVRLDQYGHIDSLQANTDYQKLSLLQKVDWAITSSMSWKNTIYFQSSQRGIPAALGETNSSRQGDLNLMMVNSYQWRVAPKWFLDVSNQLWKEQIVFSDSRTGLNTQSDVVNVNSELSLTKYFSFGTKVKIALANNQANYSSDALDGGATWNRWLPKVELTKAFKKGRLAYNQCAVHYNNKWVTNGRIGINYVVAKKYRLELSGNKVFRLPVLNELHWYQPGVALGRADLLPEDGYKADFIIKRKGKFLQLNLNPHLGTYKNWIQWSGFPEIKPENIANVNVVGAIVEASHTAYFNTVRLLTQANLHWVRARYDFAGKDPRNRKQLIFTPQFTSNLTMTLITPNVGIYANGQFVGNNYSSSDNSSVIDPYLLAEFGGYYEHSQWRVGGAITNLLNTPYYTQPRTPLPGTVLKININYKVPIKPWKDNY